MNRLKIKDYPSDDRPMERLATHGVDALSDEELLAILIGTGTQSMNALDIARGCLCSTSRRTWLLRASIGDLQQFSGIGLSKSCRIIAGLNLGKRLTQQQHFDDIRFDNPGTVASYFKAKYLTESRELFCTLLLDTKHRPLKIDTVSVGTLNSAPVHPREVFKSAIQHSAHAIILSHNHPSGDPQPSDEDIMLTRRLKEAGELLSIPVLDHVIVGDRGFVSLKQRGLM